MRMGSPGIRRMRAKMITDTVKSTASVCATRERKKRTMSGVTSDGAIAEGVGIRGRRGAPIPHRREVTQATTPRGRLSTRYPPWAGGVAGDILRDDCHGASRRVPALARALVPPLADAAGRAPPARAPGARARSLRGRGLGDADSVRDRRVAPTWLPRRTRRPLPRGEPPDLRARPRRRARHLLLVTRGLVAPRGGRSAAPVRAAVFPGSDVDAARRDPCRVHLAPADRGVGRAQARLDGHRGHRHRPPRHARSLPDRALCALRGPNARSLPRPGAPPALSPAPDVDRSSVGDAPGGS